MPVTGSYHAVSQDVSDTVKAWLSRAKRRLSDPNAKPQDIAVLSKGVTSNIADVLVLRSLLSQVSTANRDKRDISRAIATKLDTTSRLLGLDCVVRDPDDGSVLMPHKQMPSIVISKQREVSQESSSVALPARHAGSQSFYAVLNVSNIRLPMELMPLSVTSRLHIQFYVFMPDSSHDVKISSSGIAGVEQFRIIWDRSNGQDINWQPNQTAVFDLSSFHWSGTPVSNKIYLICVAYRIGTMKTAVLSEEPASSKPSPSVISDQWTANIKRPVGVAVLDLFPATPVRAEPRFHSLRRTHRPSHSSLVDSVTYDDSSNLLSWQDPNGTCYSLVLGSSSASTLQEMASEPAALNCCLVDVKLTLLTTPPLVCTNAALKIIKAALIYVEPAGFLNPKISSGLQSKFYITLLEGSFSRLGSNRNTNVEVSVFLIKTIQSGSTISKFDIQTLHCSNVYDASDKPVWNEHFEVDVDEIDFDSCLHLLFSIRMRSSKSESDRKYERERFFAFMPLTSKSEQCLVAAEDRTSVALAIYRLNHHARDPSSLPTPGAYMALDWRFDEMSRKYLLTNPSGDGGLTSQKSNSTLTSALSAALSPIYGTNGPAKSITVSDGVDFCARNSLTVETLFCSCRLAQSEKLAQFLSLRAQNTSDPITHKASKLAGVFKELDTELWIHLLFPCFDKIFELITFAGKAENSELLDLIFTESLLSVLKTLLRSRDGKIAALPTKYLQTTFCSPNCFLPLADALHRSLCGKVTPNPIEVIVVCLKFAITSYLQHIDLCSKLQYTVHETVLPDFTVKLSDIVKKLSELSVKDTMLRQRCFPDVIELVSQHNFFDRSQLYQRITEGISNQTWSEKEVLDFYRVLAKSHLNNDDGRRFLLPPILAKSCQVLDAFSLSSNVSSFSAEFQVAYLALMVLQEVFNANLSPSSTSQLIPVLRFSLRVACLVAPNNDSHWLAMNVALSCGNLLTFDALEQFFSGESYLYPLEIVDFLNECLVSIEKLFANDPEIKQLASFVYMRNSIIASKILAEIGTFVIRKLSQMGSPHVVLCLRQFAHTTLTFLLQPTLEVERFPDNFNSQRFAVYLGDLRLTAASVLLSFWNDLQKPLKNQCAKVLFQSDASLVQLALSCLPELRCCACLILKDVLKNEFELALVHKRRSTLMSQVLETHGCISLFLQSIDYLVIKWPQRIREFRQDFICVFARASEQAVTETDYVESQIDLLLETVGSQLLFLEDYIAACTTSPNPVAELTCLKRLILFYKKKDLSVPYVTHLATCYQRQLSRQMFAEAAIALEELSKLVSWTDEPLQCVLQNLSLVHHQGTQRSFKEAMYAKAAELFQETLLFERAVLLYQELMNQHMKYTFDYEKLAQVHESLAALTRMIATTLRQPPHFFWVTFVGAHASILPCLQNTSFVFRAPSHLMMGDFAHQFRGWFPDVSIRHEPPPSNSTEETLPAGIHILAVEPDSHEAVSKKYPFRVRERIVSYYRVNDISRFIYVRTRKHTDGSIKGECFELECAYLMPHMLEWAEVKLEKVVRREMDAVQLAFYDVNKKNIELRASLDAYQLTMHDARNKQQDLQRGVKGIVDAPIGGGIAMYAPFFVSTNSVSDLSSLKQLHEAIVVQHLLATEGMKHLSKVMCVNVPDLRGLYEFMEEQSRKYNQVVAEIKTWQPEVPTTSSSTTKKMPTPSLAMFSSSQIQPRLPALVEASDSTPSAAETARKSSESVLDNTYSELPKPNISSSLTSENLLTTEVVTPKKTRTPPPIPPKRKSIHVPHREPSNDADKT